MTKIVKFKDIAFIQSGFYFRTESSGNVIYLQAKHFDDYGDLKETLIPDIYLSDNYNVSKYLLNAGDILFVAKGTRNFATVYKDEYGACIASSTFFTIRLTTNNVIPDYIKIILNESQKTTYFKNNLSGGTIQSIPKGILENFEFLLPSLDKQKRMIELYNLYKKELNIYNELKEKKTNLINKIILTCK